MTDQVVTDALSKARELLSLKDSTEYEISLKKCINFEYSRIVFFTLTSNHSSEFLLKLIRHSDLNDTMGECKSEDEYRMLNELYSGLDPIQGVSIPEPVLHLPEYDALVMKAYDYPLVSNLVKYLRYFSAGDGYSQYLQKLFLSGRWLKSLHRYTKVKYADGNVLCNEKKQIELRMEHLEKLDCKLVPRKFISTINSQLNRYFEELSDGKIPMTLQHGDFGSWNMLYSWDDLVIIDFTGCELGPVFSDLVSMLQFLDSRRISPFVSGRRVDQAIQSFLSGYGELDFQNCIKLWHFFEFCYRFRRLCGVINSPQDWRFEFVANRVVRKQIKWLSSQKERKYYIDLFL